MGIHAGMGTRVAGRGGAGHGEGHWDPWGPKREHGDPMGSHGRHMGCLGTPCEPYWRSMRTHRGAMETHGGPPYEDPHGPNGDPWRPTEIPAGPMGGHGHPMSPPWEPMGMPMGAPASTIDFYEAKCWGIFISKTWGNNYWPGPFQAVGANYCFPTNHI